MADVLGGLLDQLPQEIIDLLKKLGGVRACVMEFHNASDRVIRLGTARHQQGGFAHLPPSSIEPGKSGFAVAQSPANNPIQGVEGELDWLLDLDTKWTVSWKNPRSGAVTSNGVVTGINAAKFSSFDEHGNQDTAEIRYTLSGGDNVKPKPLPKPDGDATATCLVTVTNHTDAVLTLIDQGHERGDFMTFPAATIRPGESAQPFASVETPDSADQGTKGFALYQVGAGDTTWRIEWDNPEGARNTTTTTVDGSQADRFRALDQIGQGDENVPVAFTLSGSGRGVDPTPEPEYEPPTEQKQPTLRQGDHSGDGWVEYLQELLNYQFGTERVPVNGVFDAVTRKAVYDFQVREHLMHDGVVGNQTWAALREATPEQPSTDGRQPHTYVEHGAEARWATENNDFVSHNEDSDELLIMAIGVGDTPIPDGSVARVRITGANGEQHIHDWPIDPPFTTQQQGSIHFVRVPQFRATFGSGTHHVEAYMFPELGGDQIQTTFTLA